MSFVTRRISAVVSSGLVVMALAVPVAGADGTSGSSGPVGATVGYVPPNDPPAICPIDYKTNPLTLINRCRKREGVGPMVLPSNYDSLTPPHQLLVVFNLERVNRGLPPIVGLNAAINHLAQAGANANNDPDFPADSGDGSGDWATAPTVLAADYEWMYNDGPDGLSFDCTTGDEPGCWGHRDSILTDSDSTDPLVGGAAWARNNYHGKGFTWNSYAAEFIYNYQPDQLTYTWASELVYFKTPPVAEGPGAPTLTAISTKNVSTGGGQTVAITGTNLSGTPAVTFDGVPATKVGCGAAGVSCHLRVPAHVAGPADVVVTNSGGSSSPIQVMYADPALTAVGSTTGSFPKAECHDEVRVEGTVGGIPTAGMNVTYTITSGPGQWQGGGTTFVRATGAKGFSISVALCGKGRQTGTVTAQATVPGLATSPTWSFTAV